MVGLEGRIAVVTGAASGIGWATSLRLQQEGALVVMADIVRPDLSNSEARAARLGDSAFVRTDVTSRTEVTSLIHRVIELHGRVDILVNNAGIALPRSIPDTTDEEWDRVMDVNLRSVFLCTQVAIAGMRQRRDGVIINVASELGLVGASDCAAYCASKAAVIQLTRAMAVDHAGEGIRINCVCPGAVDTPLLDIFLDATGNRKQASELTARATLMGRLGRPEEIAGVIAFLASSDASYMTGAVVLADGGTTAR